MSIYKKMYEFRQQSVVLVKNAKNPYFNSNYADINNVLESINPILDELGLVVTQCPNVVGDKEVLTTRVAVADDPKEFIESHTRLFLPSADMQKFGSAITYARRYALVSMFGLEAVDDDGNDSVKVSKNKAKSKNAKYNKTPTQLLNERVNNAFEILDKAKKEGDISMAKKVFKQAVSEDLIQVQDRCINLFGDELD